jgi:hypothetical protein
MVQMLPTMSANDVAFMQAHTMAVTKRMAPRLAQSKQVHAAAGPVCTVAPNVTGTNAVGQVQTCAVGTWLNSPTLTHQWQRNRVDIAGATALTYTTVAADSGNRLDCVEIGTNGNGVTSARSNAFNVP